MSDATVTDLINKNLKPPSIADQLALFERAGVELRRRLQAERQKIVAEFERKLSDYEATVRATVIDMKAAHEMELQAHDRLSKRLESLG